MNKNLKTSYPLSKARRAGENPVARRVRRPFWIPVTSYYFISLAVALTLFFLVWAALLDSGESAPFLPAGIIAGLFLVAAGVVREVLLRRARLESIEAQRRLDKNLSGLKMRRPAARKKLSIRRNAALLEVIYQKSQAARVLKNLPDAHWEVFALCDNYMRLTTKEVARIHVNSPRFQPINEGRGRINKLHKYHLLKWAKEMSGNLKLESTSVEDGYSDVMIRAESAIECLETALDYYPREKKLIESHDAVREFAATMRISKKINEAEKAAGGGSTHRAVGLYRDALFALGRENLRRRESEMIAERINSEIERLKGVRD